MKNNPSFLLVMLALSLAAHPVSAQVSPSPSSTAPTQPSTDPADQPEPPPHPPMPPAPPWLKALDANNDKIISAEEITNASTALRTLDLNKDGSLTPDELHPKPPTDRDDKPPGDRPPKQGRGPKKGDRDERRGPGHRPPPPPVIHALDADDDHQISTKEIDQAPANLKKLDKNNDGQLTGDEIHPPRPPMPPEDGGPDEDAPPEPPI